MAKHVTKNEIEEMMDKLTPILTRAIQGDFTGRIDMKQGDRLNEIYAGIQTLLDIINDQIEILDEIHPETKARYSLNNHKSTP